MNGVTLRLPYEHLSIDLSPTLFSDVVPLSGSFGGSTASESLSESEESLLDLSASPSCVTATLKGVK